MTKAIVVKKFTHNGRECVIVKIDAMSEMSIEEQESLKKHCKSIFSEGHFDLRHNGYIEVKENEQKEDYNEYEIHCEEITYQGHLEHFQELTKTGDIIPIETTKLFIGFDTAHSYNHSNPKSKTLEAVEEKCKKIVDELNENIPNKE